MSRVSGGFGGLGMTCPEPHYPLQKFPDITSSDRPCLARAAPCLQAYRKSVLGPSYIRRRTNPLTNTGPPPAKEALFKNATNPPTCLTRLAQSKNTLAAFGMVRKRGTPFPGTGGPLPDVADDRCRKLGGFGKP